MASGPVASQGFSSLDFEPVGPSAENDERHQEARADMVTPLCFAGRRHQPTKQLVEELMPWRLKERMKTVSVALVLCLNVGVDPPDAPKSSPCARMECWTDPFSMNPSRALETIGAGLQRQYERWQPRARYKSSLDPTVDEVKRVCTTMRRNAKDERVLFHYNGHGVPRPTRNGEIWVFNKAYTQYIPLSLYDLQTWTGSPSIYIWECNAAGIIVEEFKRFMQIREEDRQKCSVMGMSLNAPNLVHNAIQLAACGPDETLPLNPDMPADLFTSCLTTPIKTSLRWWFYRSNTKKMVPDITAAMLEKIPGRLTDRRTALGELNWIFTAIADTIAWDILPTDVFQDLFRHDLLVASLFRNFLLAELVMDSYGCKPISCPAMPSAKYHPMWQMWDMVMDACLVQLPQMLENDTPYEHSQFFSEQLQAFAVWLGVKNIERPPPQQLPVVLQVLLSPVHRCQALELLGHYLDLGPQAVHTALNVGIFPYVVKLLQSTAPELKQLLVFVWSKILAVDPTCKADLIKDGAFKYFLRILTDPTVSCHLTRNQDYQAMAAFVLTMIVKDHRAGQEVCLQSNLIATCLDLLDTQHIQLRQWVIVCLGCMWDKFDKARWCGVRDRAHEKLFPLLADPNAETRAAVIYALGKYLASSESDRNDQSKSIDRMVGDRLTSLVLDGSHLVREELCLVFRTLISTFEGQFVAAMADDAARQALPNPQRSQSVSSSPTVPLHKKVARTGSGSTGGGASSASDSSPSLSCSSQNIRAANTNDTVVRASNRGSDWVILDNAYEDEIIAAAAESRHGNTTTASPVMSGVQLNSLNRSDPQAPHLVPRHTSFHNTALNSQAVFAVGSGSSSSGPSANSPGIYNPAMAAMTTASLPPGTTAPGGGVSGLPAVNGALLNMWRALNMLATDPHMQVEMMADRIIKRLKLSANLSRSNSLSLPSSPRANRHRHSRHTAGTSTGSGGNAAASGGNSGIIFPPPAQKEGDLTPFKRISMPRILSMPTGDGHGIGASSERNSPRLEDKASTMPRSQSTQNVNAMPRMVEDYYGDLPSNLAETVDQFDTKFVEWMSSSFILQRDEMAKEFDNDGPQFLERHWRFNRNADIRTDCKTMLKDTAGVKYRLEDQVFVNQIQEPPVELLFHPYQSELCVADRHSVSVWNWEEGVQISSFHNHSVNSKARITTLDLVNPHDVSLLMVGTDDGCVRVWRDYNKKAGGSQVAAWRALTDMTPLQKSSSGQQATPGLVLDWEQESGVLFASGNARIIRVWDTRSEQIIQDIPTSADTCVTSLTSDIAGRSLLIAGCGDGSIRLYDRRLPPADCLVRKLQEHTAYVVKVHLQQGASQGKIISASVAGDVRYWDPRFQESTHQIKTSMRVSCMDVHHCAPLLTVGSRDQIVKTYHIDTQEKLGVIKWHDGFMGQRIAPVNALKFHPYQMQLVAGFTDCLVSIYADEKKKA